MTSEHGDLFREITDATEPHALLHRIRRDDPVHFVASRRFWFVTKHAHVLQLLHDPDNVSPDGRIWESYVPAPEGTFMRWMADNGLSTLEPAQHQRLRKLASAAFTPRAVQRMSQQIAAVIAQLAAPLARQPDDVVDLFASFVNVVPAAVINGITGIRPHDPGYFSQAVRAMLEGAIPFASELTRQRAEASFAELAGWIRSALALRRVEPADDLLSDLAAAAVDELRLTEGDIVLLLCSIIAAGVVTVATMASVMIRVVLERPAMMHAIRTEPGLAYRSIDELMRYSAGPSGPVRFARHDFSLGDKRILRGQMVMLSTGGACRDPAVYEDPDVLQLDRKVEDLLVFGRGPHHCLGAALARHELACMLASLAQVLPPGSRLREDQFVVTRRGMFQAPSNVPVELGHAAPATNP